MSIETTRPGRPAVWAGIECTINRVGNRYFDQLDYSGHYNRPQDISQLAALGIESLRYPILWERHQPVQDTPIDWTFSEGSLTRIRECGIVPIAGLVHHGSGPVWVNFFDGSFEEGLANYALEVAKKFPWIEHYTPVNEPLTTARFCGLYGHWYPHGRSDEAFARILVAECKATVMAMSAIRTINPEAKLIQTDDLGKTHCSPALQYQADFENERRWLAFDLIGGKVKPGHPMWNYLLWAGIDEGELYYFLEHTMIPHIIGLNYYLTSERYIDDALEHYPQHTHGGNGIHQYADVEAVRVDMGEDAESGAAPLIREAWNRYGLPLAITEAHLHCTREQQGRWLQHIWHTATELKEAEGIDIRAVTAWAAFGSYGWNRLLTEPHGEYEPGIFDVRSGQPRATALAGIIAGMAHGVVETHPAFEGSGWWELPDRLHYKAGLQKPYTCTLEITKKPLLILGATGTLGRAFSKMCAERGIHHLLWGRQEMNITSTMEEMTEKLSGAAPWAVINATGYVRVDDAEEDKESCFSVNTSGAINVAAACKAISARLLTFSSDLVFDGTKGEAYTEQDTLAPLNVYGESKAAAEKGIVHEYPDALIVRTSSFFSPWDEYNFVSIALRELAAGRTFTVADDVYVSPTYVPDLVNQTLDLLIDNATGIWHLTNEGSLSWAALAREAAALAGFDESRIRALPQTAMGWRAKRPQNSALKSIQGRLMPPLEDALRRYINAVNPRTFHEGLAMQNV